MGCIVGGCLHIVGEYRARDQCCTGHRLVSVQTGGGCLRSLGGGQSRLTVGNDVCLGPSR